MNSGLAARLRHASHTFPVTSTQPVSAAKVRTNRSDGPETKDADKRLSQNLQVLNLNTLRVSCRWESGGLFLFESHPPAFEKEGLEQVCELIEQYFRIEEKMVLNYGTYLDRGRTFVSARAA